MSARKKLLQKILGQTEKKASASGKDIWETAMASPRGKYAAIPRDRRMEQAAVDEELGNLLIPAAYILAGAGGVAYALAPSKEQRIKNSSKWNERRHSWYKHKKRRDRE